ncbi:MAG: serine/threonine-protein kinase, partial [Burkholderiales bacterium]
MSFDPQAATIRTLNTQTLRRLSPLLDQALELPEAERIPWLRGLGAEFADLVPILEGMLNPKAALQVDQVLQGIEQFQTQALQQQPHQPGEIIGPYRLKQRVGEGGMGEVWLADRTDGSLKREVALKLPTIYDQSRILLERFARERDILAALNHPHIASIYDAGISDIGQPYLALEYIGGAQSITAYARTALLDAKARVALIQQVCTAVQYAHANLVIHRDIKPGNVLVTPEGKAVLLDFGIAKLLETPTQHVEESDLTRHEGRSLTLSYAAPEQITGAPISTATDTWALGVLLYELLAGERPFQGANPSEIDQAVRTQESKPPSQCQHGVINLLGKGLARELDTIVLKALKKQPEERYSTVIALSDDLQRWLDGQPVLAKPDSLWYRSRKFVTRNRWGVAFGSAAIALLMVTSGVAAYQAHLARVESARAVAARDFM